MLKQRKIRFSDQKVKSGCHPMLFSCWLVYMSYYINMDNGYYETGSLHMLSTNI